MENGKDEGSSEHPPIANWQFAICMWQSLSLPQPEVESVHLLTPPEVVCLPTIERPLAAEIRKANITLESPWVRSLGKLGLEARTEGWRFPAPPVENDTVLRRPSNGGDQTNSPAPGPSLAVSPFRRVPVSHKLRPSADTVVLKERLLYLLQPPLENLFAGKHIHLRCQPYPYQMHGIAFLMPRHAALLADEMGLGKTMQAILALRLLFHAGLIRRVLVVCPKALVTNWARELRLWAEDIPIEIIGGDAVSRSTAWRVSNCPLQLVNYELLTRDAELISDPKVHFDVVVLDEAQRIKNRDSKTSQAVRGLRRLRSWALTGTPVENRHEDLINLFAFIAPDRIPPGTPMKHLAELTGDFILRRAKEDVLADLPPKTIRDTYLELSPAQHKAYELAEEEGVVRLNALGDTITVHHVFELILRLKQICNFDPLTGESAKLEQLQADLAEVADSGRKAILFSQWVQPLEILARALTRWGPLLFHGQVPAAQRWARLEQFRRDPHKHVLLMSYGTGSVGLNVHFANYVFLFDRWWNPAVEDQAINRAHRIGQREPVFVTRFITQGTIEGRIAEVLDKKRQLFQDLIEQNGPPPALGLMEEEIFSLFDIQVRPKRAAA
jgi:SNF2 family DNA or RNA helicase